MRKEDTPFKYGDILVVNNGYKNIIFEYDHIEVLDEMITPLAVAVPGSVFEFTTSSILGVAFNELVYKDSKFYLGTCEKAPIDVELQYNNYKGV